MKVLYEKSISVCSCYCYAHEDCLIEILNEKNKQGKEINLKCTSCKKVIGISQHPKYPIKLHCTPTNLFYLIFSVVDCFFSTNLIFRIAPTIYNIQFDISCIGLLLAVISLSIAISLLCFCTINLFLVKKWVIVEIKPTNLDVMVSAFIGL